MDCSGTRGRYCSYDEDFYTVCDCYRQDKQLHGPIADGSVGMQRGDGTYELLLTDTNGKLIGNKRMNKGVINLSAIDEKTSSGATKWKLVGKYGITAQEAKKRLQWSFSCNGNDHLAADCRKKSDKFNKSDSESENVKESRVGVGVLF